MGRNITIIKDPEGNNVVVINDILFKGKRSVSWDDVETYLKQYVGEVYKIAETASYPSCFKRKEISV